MQSKRRLYLLKTIIVIIHNSWYFAHSVKRPRIIKSCKANGILNIAHSERWSATETDSAEGKIYDEVSKCMDKKTQRTIDPGITHI